MSSKTHPVNEALPPPRLATLGLQHVLVMYAGAIAVPLIVGRALQLDPEQVAFLISADLFVCGVVSIIQSLGATQWFGIRLPVMMGVTFAAVGPMVAMANANPGVEGARMIFGTIIGAGIISMLIAPLAASSTPSRTPASRRMWALSGSPASRAAMSASPAARYSSSWDSCPRSARWSKRCRSSCSAERGW